MHKLRPLLLDQVSHIIGHFWCSASGEPVFLRVWNVFLLRQFRACPDNKESHMNGLIYLIGLIVVIMFILSLLGLR
jgi:hypothetical protein